MSARLSVGAAALATSVGMCVSLHAQPANEPEALPQIQVTGKRHAPVRRRHLARRPATRVARAPAPVAPVAPPAPVSPVTPAPTATQVGAPGLRSAPGQTVTTVSSNQFIATPAFEISDLLQYSPGISIKQGNGPRDEGISIRGSNARNGFGIRNIVIEEDGFPVTQPDGLSRSDLIDPHAYSGLDVYRGPSSAWFGNYATGGAINFHSWTGAQINGLWYGAEGGSFGYLNNYVDVGRKVGPFEYSLFASDVRGDGFISNSVFDTQTVNFLGSYAVTPDDLVTMKVINNVTRTELPIRLSLNQFEENPFQKGCVTAATAAPGCATVSLDANGFSAPTVPNTAGQAGLGRHDRRTITGVRWEHDFDNDTTWRTQFVFDDKDIDQPTGSTSAVGDSPAYNIMSDLIHRYSLFGLGLTSTAGVFYNTERLSNFTYNVAPGGNATLGALSSYYNGGQQENYGARARGEIKFNDSWSGIVGADIEQTQISTVNTINSFPGGVATPAYFPIDTQYLNHAEEAGLLFRPNNAWQFRARVGTGYGTPNISQLTVTPAGVSGNNTALKTQTNVGYDLGADYTPNSVTKISVTGFYEFFTNEQVTQSPGAGLLSYTFNAPASQHRGVEAAIDWLPDPGWRLTAAYTYIDEFYTDYLEQLSAGGFTAIFNRDGNKIPGVSPNELLTRVAYDQPTGPWQGLGGFIEYQFKDGYFIDNANFVKVPAYGVVNLNTHYVINLTQNDLRSATLFFEIRNIFNKTYVASANDISDSLNSTTGGENPGSVLATSGTGSIYAGAPRSFVAGFKLAFR
jgi:iron complex outermembrane recepter protein